MDKLKLRSVWNLGKVKLINYNVTTLLRSKTVLSGEVFKENFTDIFQTNLEQVAFSLQSQKKSGPEDYQAIFWKKLRSFTNRRLPYLTTTKKDSFCYLFNSKKKFSNTPSYDRSTQMSSPQALFSDKFLRLGKLPEKQNFVFLQSPFPDCKATHANLRFARTALIAKLRMQISDLHAQPFRPEGERRGAKAKQMQISDLQEALHLLDRRQTARLTNRKLVRRAGDFSTKTYKKSKQGHTYKEANKRELRFSPKTVTSIFLNLKIGDYLSSGDKIGEKSFCKKRLRSVLQSTENKARICKTQNSACKKICQVAIKPYRQKQSASHITIARVSYGSSKSKICKTRFVRKHGNRLWLRKSKTCFPPLQIKNLLDKQWSCNCKSLPEGASPLAKQSFALHGFATKIYTPIDQNGADFKHPSFYSAHDENKQGEVKRFVTQSRKNLSKKIIRLQNIKCPLFLWPFKKRSCSLKKQELIARHKTNLCTTQAKKEIEFLKKIGKPIILNSSGRVVTISKTQLILQKTQPILFYNSANLHVKKGEWVKEGSPILTLTHQTLITGDIVQGIPRIEQLFEAFTSPPPAFKDKRAVTKFKDVHDTLHSQVRDIFRKHWLKSVLPIAVRKSLEEIQYLLVEMIQKVYLSQGVLIADKHIEIIIRQIASKGQILDSGATGLFLEEVLPIRQIENANLTTPGKKCLYVPAVMGLTATALNSDSFISAASFQETTRVLSRDAVVGKSDFLRGLKEKVVIGDLISAGTGLDIYFIYTTMLAS